MMKKNNETYFYDNRIPALKTGNYTISAKLSVDCQTPEGSFSSKQYREDFKPSQQTLQITGPRFLLPPEDIARMYPPPNCSGQFELNLPYILFNQDVIPWESPLNNDAPEEDRHVPWCALLLFFEDELVNTMDTLISDDTQSFTTTLGYLRTLKDTFIPSVENISKSEENIRCQSIRVKNETLRTILPTFSELPYLAHCRQNDKERVSVVMANRFPKAPQDNEAVKKNSVHLVSLQGFKAYLKPDGSLPEGKTYVQLISLARWSFNCLCDPKENFTILMNNLLEPPHELTSSPSLFLKLPTSQEETDVYEPIKQRLDEGYIPLSFITRAGETTFAWYRGPFIPCPADNTLIDEPFLLRVKSADTLMVYDNSQGIFDQRYASAWALGRMLALAKETFTVELAKLRRTLLEQKRQETVHSTRGLTRSMSSSLPPKRWLFEKMFGEQDKKTQGLIKQLQDLTGGKKISAPSLHPASNHQNTSQNFNLHWYKKSLNLIPDQKIELPQAIKNFWQSLWLLKGVPFQYLIAHEKVLPQESLRLFYIDETWMKALVIGALSLGIHSEVYLSVNSQIYHTLMSETSFPKSGLLLRSAVVSAWPNLQIHAVYSEMIEKQHLRMERLSADVLICLFKDVPNKIEISESTAHPSLGLVGDNLRQGFMQLRRVVPETTEPNATLGAALELVNVSDKKISDVLWRDIHLQVIAIEQLKQLLTEKLKESKQSIGELTPSMFLLQFIREPELASITWQVKSPSLFFASSNLKKADNDEKNEVNLPSINPTSHK